MATEANEPISSRTADVIIPVAAFDLSNPSFFNETMVSDTAVAVIARPHMIETLMSCH